MFDPNANPEDVAARASELALEQLDRRRAYMEKHPDTVPNFYKQGFEIGVSNNIAKMMGAYAVLKGYVTPERAHIEQ